MRQPPSCHPNRARAVVESQPEAPGRRRSGPDHAPANGPSQRRVLSTQLVCVIMVAAVPPLGHLCLEMVGHRPIIAHRSNRRNFHLDERVTDRIVAATSLRVRAPDSGL